MAKKRTKTSKYINKHVFKDGMALLYQKSDQKKKPWWCRIRVPGHTGYVVRSTKLYNFADAKAFADKLYEGLRWKAQNDLPLKSGRFIKVFEEFLAAMEVQGMSIHRLRVFRSFGTRYWGVFFGQKHLERLRQRDFEEYFLWRMSYWTEGPGVELADEVYNHAKIPSRNTMKMERQTLGQFLKWAHRYDYIRVVPELKAPKRDGAFKRERRPSFTTKEFQRLTRYLSDWTKGEGYENVNLQHKHQRMMVRHAVLISANTGLRPQELHKLKWHQVSYAKNERYKNPQKWNTMIQIPSDSKTGAREAIATADAFIYFQRLNEFSPHNGPDDYVICDYHGKSVHNWGRTLTKILTELDMLFTTEGKKRTRYSFRHYFITQRLETGVPIHLVAHICGTSVGNITRHYFHVTKEERLKASILGYMENALDAATDTTDTIS